MRSFFEKVPILTGERVTLKAVDMSCADGMRELVSSVSVYQYLPTFLFEKKYNDVGYVISLLYDECIEESLILGVFSGGEFCGLAEMYGYREELHKISVGYRLLERFWGKGIATEALGLMVSYLYGQTDMEIITASTMVENKASAKVLIKNGFELVVHAADEDWGYERPTPADKWIR